MENSVLLLWFNTHAGVGNLKNKTSVFIGGAHGDAAVLPTELHRIVEQVPKDLLKSDGIGPDVMPIRAEVHHQIQVFLENLIARDFKTVSQKVVDIDDFEVEIDFSAGNASQIQQIVNQAGLQLNAGANSSDFFAKLGRQIFVFCQVACRRQCRGQRCS